MTQSNHRIQQEEVKKLVIVATNHIVHPNAIMIHAQHALVTKGRVMRTWWLVGVANVTKTWFAMLVWFQG